MLLKVLLPKQVLVEEQVRKVIAEGQNGSFCLLPRHVDFVSALVPGLLVYETAVGVEAYLAVDEGILVKCGAEVLVSTRHAAQGANLGELQMLIRQQFTVLDEREKQTRSALAKIEADFVRRFMEL
ncbi:MAG: F0F1 ATP synthase subunit epsilon [Chloroflexota bacterium]